MHIQFFVLVKFIRWKVTLEQFYLKKSQDVLTGDLAILLQVKIVIFLQLRLFSRQWQSRKPVKRALNCIQENTAISQF